VAVEVDNAPAGAPPVVLSGDCTAAVAVAAGLQRRGVDPAVVWFDAHGDLHTPESSASGYPGGMALRNLLTDGDPAPCACWTAPEPWAAPPPPVGAAPPSPSVTPPPGPASRC
jgi:arginase family enzyme